MSYYIDHDRGAYLRSRKHKGYIATFQESATEQDKAQIVAAPELLSACTAAWNCIAELPPTQARVETATMLAEAIKKAGGGRRMNFRKGGLVAADFDQSSAQPAPTFPVDAIEHTSDFGVIEPGADFSAPPPRRMWQEERDDPRLICMYGWTFTAAIVASAIFVRCS